MIKAPLTITTQRIFLRPLAYTDAPAMYRELNNPNIARYTLNLPYPYLEGMAEAFVLRKLQQFHDNMSYAYAITLQGKEELIGCIELTPNWQTNQGELGYWIAETHWNKGYMTESTKAIISMGFETLALHRIHASFIAENHGSHKVMEKAGMRLEGMFRQDRKQGDKYVDSGLCAILASEYHVK